MIRATALALAFFGTSVVWSNASFADGALAIGMPGGDPNKGFKHVEWVNDPNAAAEAMRDCRAARNPNVGAACRLIGTFRDQCVAVAVNGDAVNDETAPIIAAGWAIAPTKALVINRAVAQCEAMRRGRRGACQIEGKVLCDGNAQ